MVPSARSEESDIEQTNHTQNELTTGPEKEMNTFNNNFRIPTFEKGLDPKEWLDMYETGAKVCKVKEPEKLAMVPGYFKSSTARKWFFNQEFETWESFREEFLDRFTLRKGSAKKIIKKILEIKRDPEESIRMYIDRFDELKAAHVREIKKNETSTKLTSEDLRDAFINGIRPKMLREAVRQGKPQTLQDAKKRAKDQDDDDVFSEDEESSIESYKSHEKTKERKSKPKYSLKKEKTTLQVCRIYIIKYYYSYEITQILYKK
ncbi:hypothetical protein G6F37_012724 [Rhizopus arrhizus]|nr:hypothetical protein G6F38_011978 [Rhizopus arrhizus]KAG1141975.1 hypothetical protein G6F37_012724 [Rhizopus arrhizus]